MHSSCARRDAYAVGENRDKTAELCRAFVDDTRLDILDRLKEGERGVCELTDALQTGQSRLSFQLIRMLKKSTCLRRPLIVRRETYHEDHRISSWP
jgi:DNA-binding transcriptional ArsR family regulator